MVNIQKITEETNKMLEVMSKIKHLQSLKKSDYVWIKIKLTDKEKRFLKYFDKYNNFNNPELWGKVGLARTQVYSYFYRLQKVYPESAIKVANKNTQADSTESVS